MSYPKYVEVNNKRYKINTSYKIALKCNEIAEDDSINDIERALAIIYILFGEEALDDVENRQLLIEKAKKYLTCNEEGSNEERDMDFEQDMPYIKASFMSDYHIDLNTTDMHFWEFYELLNGLSNSDIGNCCILNRIRNIRNMNLSDIKDVNEKERLKKAKKSVAIKRKKKLQQSYEQKESARKFYENLFRKE